MQQSSLHSARDLPEPVRNAIEQLLGRALGDDEEVSIRAYQPHEGPSVEQQRLIAEDLRRLFQRTDQKATSLSLDEQEEALDEAIRSVRPGYRSAK
jgi:hypothetical protein